MPVTNTVHLKITYVQGIITFFYFLFPIGKWIVWERAFLTWSCFYSWLPFYKISNWNLKLTQRTSIQHKYILDFLKYLPVSKCASSLSNEDEKIEVKMRKAPAVLISEIIPRSLHLPLSHKCHYAFPPSHSICPLIAQRYQFSIMQFLKSM